MATTEAERIEAICTAIMRYLGIRPQSADTVEGIHRWWIDWHDDEAPIDLTDAALQLLLERGEMEQTHIAGRAIWRLRRG